MQTFSEFWDWPKHSADLCIHKVMICLVMSCCSYVLVTNSHIWPRSGRNFELVCVCLWSERKKKKKTALCSSLLPGVRIMDFISSSFFLCFFSPVCLSVFTSHLSNRVQVGSPVTMKLQRLPTMIERGTFCNILPVQHFSYQVIRVSHFPWPR